jgi:hypothetical protein
MNKTDNTSSLSISLGKASEIHSDKGYEESTLEKVEEFAKNRNYHYSNTDNPIDFPKETKYYTIVFPGEFGQHVQETWTREQILKVYWTSWNRKMFQSGNSDKVSEENCIEDWIVTHWAEETDEFGNKL